MNTLMESAFEGALPHTACFGLTQPEASPPTLAEHERFYRSLSGHYPAASNLFAAFLRHARIDAELRHEQTTIDRILEAGGDVEKSGRRAIIRSVRRLAENFIMFFEQISDYYTNPSRQFPRRAPGIAELLRT